MVLRIEILYGFGSSFSCQTALKGGAHHIFKICWVCSAILYILIVYMTH